MGDVIISLTPKSWIAQRKAILSASVPPEVNIISLALAPIDFAICLRAVSTTARADLPILWDADGFP